MEGEEDEFPLFTFHKLYCTEMCQALERKEAVLDMEEKEATVIRTEFQNQTTTESCPKPNIRELNRVE